MERQDIGVIVLCPSCSTRYRPPAAMHDPCLSGRCSRCDEVVPLVQPKRRYVLMPPHRVALQLGLDDSQLAPQLGVSVPPVAASVSFAAATVVDGPPEVLVQHDFAAPYEEPLAAGPAAIFERDPALSQSAAARSGAPERFDGAAPHGAHAAEACSASVDCDRAPEEVGAAEDGAADHARRTPQPLLELLAAGIPALVCGSLAYYLALREHADPPTWTAFGAAAGLLLGWSCLRWMRRSRH